MEASLMAQVVKNPPAMQEMWVRSLSQEDSLEEGYSCLKNPMDREACWVTVHEVAKVGHDWALDGWIQKMFLTSLSFSFLLLPSLTSYFKKHLSSRKLTNVFSLPDLAFQAVSLLKCLTKFPLTLWPIKKASFCQGLHQSPPLPENLSWTFHSMFFLSLCKK